VSGSRPGYTRGPWSADVAGVRWSPAGAAMAARRRRRRSTLVELKKGQGRESPAERRTALDSPTLYRLLGYVLNDRNHARELTHVALYQARYGHFAVWAVEQLLKQARCQPRCSAPSIGSWGFAPNLGHAGDG
jgi:hypothetical protein